MMARPPQGPFHGRSFPRRLPVLLRAGRDLHRAGCRRQPGPGLRGLLQSLDDPRGARRRRALRRRATGRRLRIATLLPVFRPTPPTLSVWRWGSLWHFCPRLSSHHTRDRVRGSATPRRFVMRRMIVWVVSLTCWFGGTMALGQENTAEIRGSVLDSQDAAVPGVTITITHQASRSEER